MTNNELQAWKWTQAKNMVLSISGVALTLGLYALDAGLFSMLGLMPFMCLSTVIQVGDKNEQG